MKTKLSALIAGDSITRRLSPAKMSDQHLQVKIRSHPGGKVDTIVQNILEMSDNEHMKGLDLVVLHVGTNDINFLMEKALKIVAKKLETAVFKIKKVCTNAKVMIQVLSFRMQKNW